MRSAVWHPSPNRQGLIIVATLALAYVASHFFRASNVTIGLDLMRDLSIGPEALGLGVERLREILAGDNRRLHSLLRDQRALAGIGRAHANEILNRAQLSPFALSSKLGDEEIERLAAAIDEDLARALELREAGKGDKDVYLVHRRLYFEEVNAERYGWDAGPIQPVFSAMYFYRDCLMWPHNLASGLWRERYDTSAGKCLPGNTVPYYLYPEEITLFGATVGAVAVTGAAFIFP